MENDPMVGHCMSLSLTIDAKIRSQHDVALAMEEINPGEILERTPW